MARNLEYKKMSEALIEPVVIDYDSLGEELTRILPQELDCGCVSDLCSSSQRLF